MLKILLLASILGSGIFSHSQQSYKKIASTGAKDIIPEGIAIDAHTGLIYISSIVHHKIVVLDSNGKYRDFITSGQDGYLEGLGMKIDPKRNWLWALSNAWGKVNTSQLHAFDLTTGKLKKHFILNDTAGHGLNDLVLDETGKIYCTDTYYGAVYQAGPDATAFTLLVKDSLTESPNGIALGNNNQLYIATYAHGLVRYDMTNKLLSKLTGYRDTAMCFNLDGLAYSNHSLIGVYNGDSTNKKNAVIHYKLDPSGSRIIEEKTIDQGNPFFHEPTTLDIANKRIYVLANSHLGAFNENKLSVLGIENKLSPPVILSYPEP